MMNENVIALLKAQLWMVATASAAGEPNAVPVGLKDVTDDGKLVIGDVFLETTKENVKATGRAAVSACNGETAEGYQVKGAAVYETEGPVVEALRKAANEHFHGALAVRGAVVITPETVIVTTPGPDNKKVL